MWALAAIGFLEACAPPNPDRDPTLRLSDAFLVDVDGDGDPDAVTVRSGNDRAAVVEAWRDGYGRRIWRSEAGPASHGDPWTPGHAVIDGLLVLNGGGADGVLYALRLQDGALAWSRRLERRRWLSSPRTDGARVLAITRGEDGHERLSAVDAHGELEFDAVIGQVEAPGVPSAWGAPVPLASGVWVFGDRYAVRVDRGHAARVLDGPDAPPWVEGGRVCSATPDLPCWSTPEDVDLLRGPACPTRWQPWCYSEDGSEAAAEGAPLFSPEGDVVGRAAGGLLVEARTYSAHELVMAGASGPVWRIPLEGKLAASPLGAPRGRYAPVVEVGFDRTGDRLRVVDLGTGEVRWESGAFRGVAEPIPVGDVYLVRLVSGIEDKAAVLVVDGRTGEVRGPLRWYGESGAPAPAAVWLGGLGAQRVLGGRLLAVDEHGRRCVFDLEGWAPVGCSAGVTFREDPSVRAELEGSRPIEVARWTFDAEMRRREGIGRVEGGAGAGRSRLAGARAWAALAADAVASQELDLACSAVQSGLAEIEAAEIAEACAPEDLPVMRPRLEAALRAEAERLGVQP